MRGAWSALVALALACAACGRAGPPLPPELVQPTPPSALVARAVADGVELGWHRPEKYSGGQDMRDLGGFDVERTVVDGTTTATYARVGHIELTDQLRFRHDRRLSWTDHDVSPGTRYAYRVTAFTLDGYRSRPAGPVTVVYQPHPHGGDER